MAVNIESILSTLFLLTAEISIDRAGCLATDGFRWGRETEISFVAFFGTQEEVGSDAVVTHAQGYIFLARNLFYCILIYPNSILGYLVPIYLGYYDIQSYHSVNIGK